METAERNHYLSRALLCVGFFLAGLAIHLTAGMEWASLDLNATRSGEVWRLITGHLTHLDWHHFYLNMAALTLSIVVFHRDVLLRDWIGSFFFVSIFSSLGMCYVYAEFDRYVGFSDVIHGWILLGAASIAHREPKLATAIFVLFWLKIVEEHYQFDFFTSYGLEVNIAKESHIYGALGGILYSLLFIPSFRGAVKKLLPGRAHMGKE